MLPHDLIHGKWLLAGKPQKWCPQRIVSGGTQCQFVPLLVMFLIPWLRWHLPDFCTVAVSLHQYSSCGKVSLKWCKYSVTHHTCTHSFWHPLMILVWISCIIIIVIKWWFSNFVILLCSLVFFYWKNELFLLCQCGLMDSYISPWFIILNIYFDSQIVLIFQWEPLYSFYDVLIIFWVLPSGLA